MGDETAAGDDYGAAAEFYDLLGRPEWLRRRPAVLRALTGAGRGAVLDVGAGTGTATVAAAAALPGVPVVAVEPSAPMRAVLLGRIAADPDLAARVTVLPLPLDAAWPLVPDRLGAALVLGVIGHLDAATRACLFAELAARLETGAPALVDLLPAAVTAGTEVPERRLARTRAGALDYEVWNRGVPLGGRLMRWHFRYRVLRGAHVLREVETAQTWDCLDLAALAAEARLAGLGCTPLGHDVVVLRRPGPMDEGCI